MLNIKFHFFSYLFLILFIYPGIAHAGIPSIYYSDLVNGPKITGKDNKGAFVTIYGRDFGATKGLATVSVGGGQVDNYLIWTHNKITFQLGPQVETGNIVVTTSEGSSQETHIFTVNDGHVYFVAGEANTGGSGTYENPWSSPAYFVNQISPGDICYFHAGTYTGKYGNSSWGDRNFAIGSSHSGETNRHVAFIAYPGENVTFTGQGQVFSLYDGSSGPADYIVAAGLNMYGFTGAFMTGGSSMMNENGGKGVRVVGNKCVATYTTQNTMTGIVVIQNDDSYILGNDFSNNATVSINNNHAVYVQTGADNAVVAYNFFHDLKMGHVIQVHTDGADQYGMVFENYKIYNNTIIANNPSDCRGINAAGWVAEGTYGSVYNNILINVGQNFSAIFVNNGDCKIYNNTLYNTQNSIRFQAGDFFGNMTVKNNLIYTTDTSAYIATSSPLDINDQRITIDNNLYYGNGNGPSQDQNAINADPMFVDANNQDFSLQEGSPARDSGLNLISVVDIDFKNRIRPQGSSMDIGALEYLDGASPTPTPAPAIGSVQIF